jgi:hypothetical protein
MSIRNDRQTMTGMVAFAAALCVAMSSFATSSGLVLSLCGLLLLSGP